MTEMQTTHKLLIPKITGVTDTTEPAKPLSATPAEAPPASPATAKATVKTKKTEGTKMSQLSDRELSKKVEVLLDGAIDESKIESTSTMKAFLRSVIGKHLEVYISKGFVALAYVQWHRVQLATAKKLRAELKKISTT